MENEKNEILTNSNQATQTELPQATSSRYHLTVLMCLFFGGLGIHRFINKKIGSGLAMLLSTIFSFIFIIVGFFTFFMGFASLPDYTSAEYTATSILGSVLFFISLAVLMAIGLWVSFDLTLILCQRFKNKDGENLTYNQPFFSVWSNIVVVVIFALSAVAPLINTLFTALTSS